MSQILADFVWVLCFLALHNLCLFGLGSFVVVGCWGLDEESEFHLHWDLLDIQDLRGYIPVLNMICRI